MSNVPLAPLDVLEQAREADRTERGMAVRMRAGIPHKVGADAAIRVVLEHLRDDCPNQLGIDWNVWALGEIDALLRELS